MPSMGKVRETYPSHKLSVNGKPFKEDRRESFIGRKQRIALQRKSLPIAPAEKLLLERVRINETLIIVAETGSGKTTQLPQFLYNAGFCNNGKIIGITQPRRVAAITVAMRVAEETGTQLGEKVGYSIRFDDVTSISTRIKYMTDGLLLREAIIDPYLCKYSVIIVDEAHERTVHTDVLLGLLKNVQHLRSQNSKELHIFDSDNVHDSMLLEINTTIKPCAGKIISPLKLIIMSASLDAQVFSEYFSGSSAVHVLGRQFSVDVFYTFRFESDYIEAAFFTIFQIHVEEGPGDILVFLTGHEDIDEIERHINDHLRKLPEYNQRLLTVPFLASLPSEQVFRPAPAGFRKVILATNVAETSVTIPGIKFVVDSGLVKVPTFNPRTGMESLIIIKTSKAQALQRSGRAGREENGKCFRLYPECEFANLRDSIVPEIRGCNLSNIILQLKALGINDIMEFDFIEKPDRLCLVKPLEHLLLLGALTEDYKLSDLGRKMARLPLDPAYSKALILASTLNCLEEMLITVAMLSAESLFYIPRTKREEAKMAIKCFSSPEGDHITLVNVYRGAQDFLEKAGKGKNREKIEKIMRKWCEDNFINSRSLRHAQDIHSQIKKAVEQMGLRVGSCGDDMLQFRRCLAASLFLKAAVRQPDGTYMALASGQTVQICHTSVLWRRKPECVIFDKLVRTTQNFISNVTTIDVLWLPELASQFYTMQG